MIVSGIIGRIFPASNSVDDVDVEIVVLSRIVDTNNGGADADTDAVESTIVNNCCSHHGEKESYDDDNDEDDNLERIVDDGDVHAG